MQQRTPGSAWTDDDTKISWQNEAGEDGANRDELVPCPEGWEWNGEWMIEKKRAVDSEGWEYTDEIDYENYGPIERNYHQARRRKWSCLRIRTNESTKVRRDINRSSSKSVIYSINIFSRRR